jgi:hypothetical protein
MFKVFRRKPHKPQEIIFHPHMNVPERFSHSESIVRVALKPYFGTEYETLASAEWRDRFERFRRECFFIEAYPGFCAHDAWRDFYRKGFDELITSFRESLPKVVTYTQTDVLRIAETFLPLLPSCDSAEEVAALLSFSPPVVPLVPDRIYMIARGLFSALPPCRHPYDDHKNHLWFCRVLEWSEASSFLEDEACGEC